MQGSAGEESTSFAARVCALGVSSHEDLIAMMIGGKSSVASTRAYALYRGVTVTDFFATTLAAECDFCPLYTTLARLFYRVAHNHDQTSFAELLTAVQAPGLVAHVCPSPATHSILTY